MWILDIGVSCRYHPSVQGLTEVKEINKSIKIENVDLMKATKNGKIKCEVTQFNGEKFAVTLNDVKSAPDLCVNLFRFKKLLKASRSVMMVLLSTSKIDI
jgi:hypothetical protein